MCIIGDLAVCFRLDPTFKLFLYALDLGFPGWGIPSIVFWVVLLIYSRRRVALSIMSLFGALSGLFVVWPDRD